MKQVSYSIYSGTGAYQGPPVMAPPQYYAAPPPKREPSFLQGWYVCVCIYIIYINS
jgi:hypothetical protein